MSVRVDWESSIISRPLQKLVKALKLKAPTLKVGIVSNARSDHSDNSTIGAAHEFGTSTIPKRSFLREPLAEQLPKVLEQMGHFDKETLEKTIRNSSLEEYAEIIGKLAVGIVIKGFETNGYGKWAPWAPGYKNRTGKILVDTAQLKNSIGYVVN